MTELVRLYREVGGSHRENPRGNSGSSEVSRLVKAVENLPVVDLQDLHRLQNDQSFWCRTCGSRLSVGNLSQKQCGRCGGTEASAQPMYRCTSCSEGVDPKDPRCICGGTEAMLSTEAKVVDSKPDGRHICAECREPVDIRWPTCPSCGSSKAFELVG